MPDWSRLQLAGKTRSRSRELPLATISFYGPNRKLAGKAAVAIFLSNMDDPAKLRKWYSVHSDIRENQSIGAQVIDFLESARVKSVVISDGVIGCPHEEGIDYEAGKACPQCPYWAGRDRWTGERIQ